MQTQATIDFIMVIYCAQKITIYHISEASKYLRVVRQEKLILQNFTLQVDSWPHLLRWSASFGLDPISFFLFLVLIQYSPDCLDIVLRIIDRNVSKYIHDTYTNTIL